MEEERGTTEPAFEAGPPRAPQVPRGECRLRRGVLGVLALAYIGVSGIAYTDFPRPQPVVRLTDLGRGGLEVWRRENCQTCHQLYGFGGFLGPDLTNRVSRETLDSEFASLLSLGNGAMPAFDLDARDQKAVLTFLREIDRTGQSQPTRLAGTSPVSSVQHLPWLGRQWIGRGGVAWSEAEKRGAELWRESGCGTCHASFSEGLHLAPDLSGSAIDLSEPALRTLLERGRRRMPAFPFPPDETADLSSYLRWVSRHRGDLTELNQHLTGQPRFNWASVPWFEYR